MSPPTGREALALAFSAFGERVRRATNFGQSHDEMDLYWLIDETVTMASHAYGPFLCHEGCSSCCYDLPVVSTLEWVNLYPHLLGLSSAVQLTILRQTYTMFGAVLSALILDPQQLQWEIAAHLDDQVADLPPHSHCPALAEDRCQIYAVRPIACRTYGHFMRHTKNGSKRPYMCGMAQEHLQSHFPADAILPLTGKLWQRVRELHAGVIVGLPLPVWVATHATAGSLQPVVDPAPDHIAGIAGFLASARTHWGPMPANATSSRPTNSD